ncbi:hypothetical protein EDD86DRAFT_200886 [Gorgonomyces haynaldii]|nr:hypothetical protein EDD86DRAFT_200886 [Gorgonomyces haynaldii]
MALDDSGIMLLRVPQRHNRNSLHRMRVQELVQFKVEEESVSIQIVQLNDAFVISITDREQAQLQQLAVAIPTKYDKMASSTTLVNPTLDNNAQKMAKLLATKTEKQVFVTYDLEKESLFHPVLVKTVELLQSMNADNPSR